MWDPRLDPECESNGHLLFGGDENWPREAELVTMRVNAHWTSRNFPYRQTSGDIGGLNDDQPARAGFLLAKSVCRLTTTT
ncbi:MAG: hypothetical protein Aurels2KO_26880 [Aureliella sp.]